MRSSSRVSSAVAWLGSGQLLEPMLSETTAPSREVEGEPHLLRVLLLLALEAAPGVLSQVPHLSCGREVLDHEDARRWIHASGWVERSQGIAVFGHG